MRFTVNLMISLYFRAFPAFLNKYREPHPFLAEKPVRALIVRFFDRFAHWFGFIEYLSISELDLTKGDVQVKKTPLLDALLV
jgi:hypothetical protein